MTTTMNPPLNLTLRHTTSADREPVVAWCHTLWPEGHDFIEWRWDEWQAEGNLFVAILPDDPVPVAVMRMRYLSEREAWFAGLRIHPRLHGQGIGTWLIKQAETWAIERGCHSLGYMTEVDNQAMHHLGAKHHFTHIGQIHVYFLQIAPQLAEVDRNPTINLADSAQLQAQNGRYCTHWGIQELNQARLEYHAQRGELFVLADQSAWAIVEQQFNTTYHLAFVEGSGSALQRLMAHLRTLPQIGKLKTTVWQNTPYAKNLALLEPDSEDDYYDLFEKHLTTFQ